MNRKCVLANNRCGAFKKISNEDKLYDFEELDLSVKTYLVRLKLLQQYDQEPLITEKELIESRCGIKFTEESSICSYHRYSLGVYWSPSRKCKHPDHHITSKRQPTTRAATFRHLETLKERYNVEMPIGSQLCMTHIKALNEVTEDDIATMDDSIVSEYNDCDEEFHPDHISQEECKQSNEAQNALSLALDMSPNWQVKRKSVEDLSNSSLKSLKTKYKKAKCVLKERFAESIAPGQCTQLADLLSSDDEDVWDSPMSDELQSLVSTYDSSDKVGKSVILALASKNYSKQEIMDAFKCTKWKVDQARKIQQASEGITIQEPRKFSRSKLDLNKCEHFLDFIFSNGLLQDVAYGVTKLHYSNGESQTLPHAIITARYSHIISYYIHFCQSNNFQALSSTSLYRVLKALKPSQRKSLAGLDDTVAEGLNGFLTLQNVVDRYVARKKITSEKLEKGKRYLKIGFPQHCVEHSQCPSHCLPYALSDPKRPLLSKDQFCSGGHESCCVECFNLFKTIEEITEEVSSSNIKSKDDILYDLDTARSGISKWLQHTTRHVQQNKAKLDAVDKLSNTTALWIRDYCQKVLPMRFREGQCHYFGKKGMSLHVDVFLLRNEKGEIKKATYFTTAFRSEQDSQDSLSLADHVVKEFSKDFPDVLELYAKCDNAGCYHCKVYPESLYRICKMNRLALRRIDYNEPQKGKDQCDRDSAVARSALRSYVDEGNNILSAEDIFTALTEANLNDTKVAAISFNKEQFQLECSEIPDISIYHSFEFSEIGMKMWRYYNIGAGVFQKFKDDWSFQTAVVTIKQFTFCQEKPMINKANKERVDRKLCNLVFCREQRCTDVFESFQHLEQHMLQGVHNIPTATSSFDQVKQSFANRMICSTAAHSIVTSSPITTMDHQPSTSVAIFNSKGWALPVRSTFRFNQKQKLYLFTLFELGEKTRTKSSPEEVQQSMRNSFPPSEYCTSKQIASLFSRWTKQVRESSLLDLHQKIISSEKQNEDYIIQPEEVEEQLSDILQNINQDISADEVYSVGEWIVVKFGSKWYPGEIVTMSEDETEVKCMKITGKNKFVWPDDDDICWYQMNEIVCKIDPPTPVSQRAFGLSSHDMKKINELL